MKIGDRVGAILGAKGDTVEFLGYGVYAGDHTPEDAEGFMGNIARELEHTNPRIDLDNGSHVWGCECWWGPEDKIRKLLEQYTDVVEVDINEVRKEYDNSG